ncbi:asparagine synthase-related protein [Aurantiacibacter sp. MUD61]|uniref:asparagine synthase-related protein n=1 Tax=Aurantiacibacter sp. MUD61 TaxID=3009083 RepID=UPI0022EFE118|nr:asparagine synthetase B family protein [Aurantiacibacter sp. MUD61]
MENSLRLHGAMRQGHWAEKRLGLAWSTSGEFSPQDAADRQPLTSDERWAISFTGYLDHRGELCERLGVSGKDSAGLTDAQLVLLAWQKWRDHPPRYLYGSFAFIIADRHDQTLFAVRSPMSAPPIVYYGDAERYVLASAPKAIFALGDIPRDLDEQRLADSLVHNHADSEQSFYRGIKSLPLGHMARVSPEDLTIKNCFDFTSIPPIRFGRDADYLEAVQEHLDAAVGSVMRCRKLPGATLSSGLDSTTVAVTALEQMQQREDWAAQRLTTFTSIPDPEWDGITDASSASGDESGPVRALAKMYPQLDARFVDCAGMNFDADLHQLTALSETPIYAVKNTHWIIGINRAARAAGLDVLFTGVGGSTSLTASGRSLPAMQFRQLQLGRLMSSLRAVDNGRGMTANFLSLAVLPNLPDAAIDAVESWKGRSGDAEWKGLSPLNPEYAADMRVTERRREMLRDAKWQGKRDFQANNRLLATRGMRDASQPLRSALQSLTGIQARDPLADRKLFELCLAFPADQFFRNGRPRMLVRRLMKDKLPREILNAPKGRQSADWHLRLTRDLPNLSQEIDRLADDDEMARRFDIPRIQRLLATWPEKTPIGTKDHPDYLVARLGLTRVINTARFINWVKGKN